MQNNFLLEIVTPEKIVFSQNVKEVVIPSITGNLTILANHAPLINMLIPGKVIIKTADNSDTYITHSGFAKVKDNIVTLLADEVTHLDDLNHEELDSRIAEAQKAMQESSNHTGRNEHEDILHQLSSLKHSL